MPNDGETTNGRDANLGTYECAPHSLSLFYFLTRPASSSSPDRCSLVRHHRLINIVIIGTCLCCFYSSARLSLSLFVLFPPEINHPLLFSSHLHTARRRLLSSSMTCFLLPLLIHCFSPPLLLLDVVVVDYTFISPLHCFCLVLFMIFCANLF